VKIARLHPGVLTPLGVIAISLGLSPDDAGTISPVASWFESDRGGAADRLQMAFSLMLALMVRVNLVESFLSNHD
jgi:hypothetical protein